ncbi:MAG: hypothetical protein FD168_2161 [Desulfobulbaceae bacterium]|nr:MAG: hypothetical protein FD168_2161 [Desulfobulbaceae bacterium]
MSGTGNLKDRHGVPGIEHAFPEWYLETAEQAAEQITAAQVHQDQGGLEANDCATEKGGKGEEKLCRRAVDGDQLRVVDGVFDCCQRVRGSRDLRRCQGIGVVTGEQLQAIPEIAVDVVRQFGRAHEKGETDQQGDDQDQPHRPVWCLLFAQIEENGKQDDKHAGYPREFRDCQAQVG